MRQGIFENKQLAIGNWQLASQKTGSWYLVLRPLGVRLCDPLPTGHLKRENKAEIDRDWSPEKRRKKASTDRSPLGRIGVEPLFSTKVLWGVGRWLKDAGRGLQESPESRVIPRQKAKTGLSGGPGHR